MKEQHYKNKTFLTLQTCSQFAVSRVQILQGLRGFLILLNPQCQNSYRKELRSGAPARGLSAAFPTAQALGKPPSCMGVTRRVQRVTKGHNTIMPTKGPKPVLLIRLAESARERMSNRKRTGLELSPGCSAGANCWEKKSLLTLKSPWTAL